MSVLKHIKKRTSLIVSAIMAGVVYLILFYDIEFFRQFIASLQKETAYLIVWDTFLLTYLAMTVKMFVTVKQQDMEHQAHDEYEKKSVMLVLICITTVVSLVSVVREMSIGGDLTGWLASFHISLTFFTLVLSWLFMHILFALYYAHAFYEAENDSKYPLDFPYEDKPDYWDFVYFALGIGATGAVADISFTSRKLRRVGTFHSVLSFFFNASVLALLIEMSASIIA